MPKAQHSGCQFKFESIITHFEYYKLSSDTWNNGYKGKVPKEGVCVCVCVWVQLLVTLYHKVYNFSYAIAMIKAGTGGNHGGVIHELCLMRIMDIRKEKKATVWAVIHLAKDFLLNFYPDSSAGVQVVCT